MELGDSLWNVKAVAPQELLPRSRLNPVVRAALGESRWPVAITPSTGWHILRELDVLDSLDPDTIDSSMPLPLQRTRWVDHLAAHTERFQRALYANLEPKKRCGVLLSRLSRVVRDRRSCVHTNMLHLDESCLADEASFKSISFRR